MILTQTPFRMSFFGGGTDFKEFYEKYGGCVLSTTFDKYCYVTVRHLPRFFDHKTEAVYSQIERVQTENEIQHPSIRAAMKWMDMKELKIVYDPDLPARSGLGSSSSFAVGMLNAFYALKGKYADKKRLSDDAIYLERVLCHESGGIQDQIAVSYGGFNRIDFNVDGYSVRPVIMPSERKEELNSNLMLFFTGIRRFSSEIQDGTTKAIHTKTQELLEMKGLVDEAERILSSKQDLTHIGKMLDYTWKLKRGIAKRISTESIDFLYEKAIKAGAVGGKLLGAGGGGYLLFYVEKEKQNSVKAALSKLLYIPFKFENYGTRIIHYTSEDFESGD